MSYGASRAAVAAKARSGRDGRSLAPEDVASIEAIVHADYESISGGVGVARQWARDFSLYDPMRAPSRRTRTRSPVRLKIWNPTQQEYVNATDAHFMADGFSEHELAHKIMRYGNVATVFSSYEGSMARTGKEYTRGVNIYQLYFDGKRWWISSVFVGRCKHDQRYSCGSPSQVDTMCSILLIAQNRLDTPLDSLDI